MISRTESKYRSRLFAELHYKKNEQRTVDDFIRDNYGHTYKQLYIEHQCGLGNGLFAGVAMSRLAQRFEGVGISIYKTGESFKDLTDVLTEAAKKWETVDGDEKDRIVSAFNNC